MICNLLPATLFQAELVQLPSSVSLEAAIVMQKHYCINTLRILQKPYLHNNKQTLFTKRNTDLKF